MIMILILLDKKLISKNMVLFIMIALMISSVQVMLKHF